MSMFEAFRIDSFTKDPRSASRSRERSDSPTAICVTWFWWAMDIFSLSSAMIHGVERDAEYIARSVAAHAASRSERGSPASRSPSELRPEHVGPVRGTQTGRSGTRWRQVRPRMHRRFVNRDQLEHGIADDVACGGRRTPDPQVPGFAER